MDNAKLMNIADFLCANVTELTRLVDCVGNEDGLTMLNCVRKVRWTNTDPNMLCHVTTSIQQCIDDVFDDCGHLKPALMELFKGAVTDACGQKQEKTCSAVEYALTAAMCFAPPIMNVIRPLVDPYYAFQVNSNSHSGSRGGYGPTLAAIKEFDKLCKKGSWTRSIRCLSRVDQECGYSAVNTVEMQIVVDKVCKTYMSFGMLPRCVSYASENLMIKCTMEYKWPKTDANNRICHMFDSYRKCYNYLYDVCPNPPQDTMYSFFDLFVPKPCSTIQHQAMSPTCSILEFIASHAWCWTELGDTLMLAWGTRSPLGLIENIQEICSTDIYDSLACHKESEGMCGYKMVRYESAHLAVIATCNHIHKLPSLSTCIHWGMIYNIIDCLTKVTDNIGPNDIACKVTENHMKCLSQLMRTCDRDARLTIATYVNGFVMEQCRGRVRLFDDIDIESIRPKTTVGMEMERTTEGVTLVASGVKLAWSWVVVVAVVALLE